MKNKKRSTILGNLEETVASQPVSGKEEQRQAQRMSRESILNSIGSMAQGGSGDRSPINAAYEQRQAAREQARADRYQSLVRDAQSLFDENGKLNSGVTTQRLGQLSQRTREVYRERTEGNEKFLRDLDSYLQRLAAGQLASGMTRKLLPQEQRDALRDQIAGQAPWDQTGTRRRSGAGTTTTGSPAMQKWLTPQEQEEAAEREASGYVSPESYAASIRANEAAAQRIRARSRTGANGSHLRAADGGGSLTEQQQALVDDLMQRSARSRMEAEAEAARTAAFRGSDYWLERANELEAKNRESRSSYGGMMQGGTAFRETPEFTRAERQELDRARENYYYTKNAERWGSMPEDLRQKALEAAGYTTDSVLAWQSGDEAALAGMDPEQRAQRQRDQRARRNEIAAILAGAGYEPEEVIEYASRLRNAEQMGERTTAAADWATQNVGTGILGTVGTYATNLLSPVGAVGILAQKIFRGGAGAAEYRPVDYNTPSMYLSQGTSAIRGAVGGQMGAVGKFAYDTVNSAVDSAARMLVGRVIGAGLMPDAAASEAATERLSKFVSGFISTQMSGEVFANSFVQAKENGSTDADALLDSVTSAVIEGLTEKYSVEAILSNPNGLTWTALRNSFLSEGSEEMASDFLNTIYDELKNGDDSELRTQYRELLAGGATENDAFNRVFGDYVKQVVLDGLAGGLSGIAMSGAAELGESWRYGQSGVYSDPENAAALVREALELDPENRTALAARGRVEAGAGLTGRQAKELTRNNDARIAMQEAAGTSAVPTADEQLAEELYRQYGETAGAAAAQQNEDLAAELQREYGPVYRQNRALEAQEAAAQKSAVPADRSGTEAPAAPRRTAQEPTNGAERQITSRTGKGGGAARQAAETGTAEQKAPAAQERKRTGYVQPAGGTPVAGTDVVRVERAGDDGLTLLRADGSTTTLDAAKTAGTALEVLRAAEELPEYKDPLTLNGMLRAYEGYLGGGQSTPARAEDFLDSYAIALTAGAEGESRSVLAGITEDSRLRSAIETGYRRGAELAKGQSLARHLGSAGAAALEAHGYRYPEEFGAFYQAGQEGLSFLEAKRMAGVSGLGEVRKAVFTAAWEAGRKDGNDYEETSGYDLGFEDGSRYAVSDDGGQRAAGVGARGQAGAVEEGAGGSESREGGRVGGRGAGHEGARTDLKKLGVASGTDAVQRVVRRERHDYGGEVITVSDRLEVYGADGKKTTVQAISTGKDVILREGDPMYGQHRLHELEHVRQRSMTDEEITAAFKEKTKDLPDGKVRSILRAYALDYYGLYGEDSTTMGDIYREYLADRAAGIPQKETDKAVRLPDERNAARDQRDGIRAMRSNQTGAKDRPSGRYSFWGYADDGRGIYEGNFPKGTPKKAKGEKILSYIRDVWAKKPIRLKIENENGIRYIEAKFDPSFDESGNVPTDASKLMGGNRHGTSAEQRVTLDLADDYYQIAKESRYNYSKPEIGKATNPHSGVRTWHYFFNDIYFAEHGERELTPYRVSINVKEKDDGNFFYSFSAEKEGTPTQRTLHAAVNSDNAANGNSFDTRVAQEKASVKQKNRFSVSEPVEETRDLIAVHNLTEENLESSLDIGGLPSPSIAIIKAEQGHSKYGPISIVFDKSTIDPQADSRNKIYGSDAWTPTVPRVEYQVNSKRAGDLEYELNSLAKQTAGGIFSSASALRSLGIDDASSLNRQQLAEKLADNDTVRAAYLADQGKTLDPERMVKQFNRYGNEALQMLIDRVGVQELAGAVAELETGNRDAANGISDAVREIIRDTYEQNHRGFLDRKPELKQARLDRYMENNVSRVTVEDFVKDAWEMYQDGGQTKDEIDRMATREKLREAANTADVQAWIEEKLDGLLGKAGIYNGKDRYTPSGNSRSFAQLHYDYTLENIVRAMNGLQQARGEGIWGASAESFVAVGTPDYRSIDEVRADKGRLREATEEEYDALKAKLDPMIEEIITGVRNSNKAHSDNQFEEIDIIGSLLLDAAKGTKTKAAIRSVFRKNGYTISDALIARAQSLYSEAAKMPTKYFEAKPRRAVSFEEAKAIIVPDNNSAALVQRLEQGGANVIPYKAGDEQARLEALNSMREVRFSVSEEAEPTSSAEYAQMQRGRAPAGPSEREAAEQRKRQVTLLSHMTERAFELRRQFTEGTQRDLRTTDIPDVASDLLRFAGRKAMGRGELEQRLSDIAMKAARSQNLMEAYQIAKEEADYLAADMMRNATGQTDEAKDMWDGIRQTMRSGGRPVKLAITGQNRADLEREGGYEHLRKRLMGYAFLSAGGTPVDVFYEQELTPRFPTAFPDTIQNPADQLIRIVEVLDRFRQIFKSPWAGDAAEDTELLSQEILQRLYNANVQAPSAEAYAAQREEMLQAHYEQRIAETRQRMQTEMENLRRSFDEKRQGERTARQEQKDRDALLHLAQRLDRVKVGSQWKAKAAELVGNLDTIAKSMTGRTIIGDRIGNLSADGIETVGEDDLGRKYVDIETLRDWVREMQAQNPDFMPDRRTMEKIGRLDKVQIADMDIGDVRALLNAMQNLENEMRTSKKLIDAEDRRDVAIQTAETISDIRGSKGVPLTGVKAAWNRLIINEGLSPVRFLHRVTGYNDEDPLYRATQALQKGETAMHDYTRRAEAMFRGFMEDKKFMASLAGEKARTIQITGLDESGHSLTLPITPDMQIAIFLHSFNNDNIRHAERGGFVIPDLALLRKGKVEEAYTSGTLLRLRRSQMKAVEQNMTEREVQFARAVYRYFNGMSKSELNEVSRKLLGYDVATVRNYYPIETSRDFARGAPETVKRDGTIEGSGYLKSREGAAGPINLRGVTDTLERAIAQHSKYVGLAIPIRNFGKIYGNSTWRITPTEETGALLTQDVAPSSLRRVLNQKWGAGASAYIDKLMADLQNPAKEIDAWAKTMGKVRSNYAGAVLTMNASVAIKQAASYPTAAAVVGWAPLVKAMTNWEKTDINFIAEHTPLLWYRSKGFSTQELGDMAKGKKQIPKGLNWIQGIDVATVKKLWKAAEYYVRQEQPELELRSGAYWDAVTEIYERIVLETQPDYTTMERPQLLRSRNTLLQNLAMFKTQPFQNFNIAYDALANLQAKEQQLKAAQDEAHRFDSEETRERVRKAKENLKNAKKGASRAVSALLVSAAVFSAMTLLWNVIRGNLRRYKDKDKDKVTVESFLKTFGSDTAGSLAGILPFGSDAYEVFAALVLGDRYYGMEALTPSAISDFLEELVKLDDTVKDLFKVFKGDAPVMDTVQTANRLVTTASKLFGAPIENVENIGKAVSFWAMKPFMSKEEADYWYRYYTTKTTAQGRRNEDKADIYAVYRSGDRSAYESMRAAMEKWIWQANSRYQSGELTREEAQASAGETMDSAMAAQIKDEYMAGGITDAEATDLLQKIGGKDKDKAVEAVAKWHFQRDGGGKDASAAQATAYYEFAQPAGISMEAFAEAWDFHNDVEADKDSSGKTVPGSAKQKVVDYIQGLGLGRDQEKALWDALKGNWKDTDTPWE